jgi:hypothetical protein
VDADTLLLCGSLVRGTVRHADLEVNITQYVGKFDTTMGRQHELQRVVRAVAHITLDNRDARCNTWKTSGPYASDGPWVGPADAVADLGDVELGVLQRVLRVRRLVDTVNDAAPYGWRRSFQSRRLDAG